MPAATAAWEAHSLRRSKFIGENPTDRHGRIAANAGLKPSRVDSQQNAVLGAGFARNPTESQSRRPAAKVYRIVAKSEVVVFRPKGPAVHIAWPSGPGKAYQNALTGPTGRQIAPVPTE